MIMRLIAIGDIHGHFGKLIDLLRQVQPQADDRIVFLGDYIDRGPASKAVVEFLLEFEQKFPATIYLRGNHEEMLLDCLGTLRADIHRRWLLNGGSATLDSYGADSVADIPHQHIQFLQLTRPAYIEGKFAFAHASYNENKAPDEQDLDDLLWERLAPPGHEFVQVVGHSPTANSLPLFEAGRIRLDTGAGYGRKLTACDVLTHEYWQA